MNDLKYLEMEFAHVNADAITRALKTKESQDRVIPSGIESAPGSVADFAKFIANERDHLGRITKKR